MAELEKAESSTNTEDKPEVTIPLSLPSRVGSSPHSTDATARRRIRDDASDGYGERFEELRWKKRRRSPNVPDTNI